jgi:RecA-family ATPase
VLFGPAGVGKSFVALDLAQSIGLGNSWLSFETTTGSVMYVAAGEGGTGLKYRIRAWKAYNETVPENVAYGLDPVQLHKPASVSNFVNGLEDAELQPDLIIFDTLARCSVGIDENSVEGMGTAIQGIDRIRDLTKACVMVVHHSGKPDKEGYSTYRGSTALEGAADTMMQLVRERGSETRLTLSCTKQKDAQKFFPIRLRLEPVTLTTGTSAVPVRRVQIP